MGIVKMEDVIAWECEDGAIYCKDCGDKDGQAMPLTEDDFSSDACVYCDGCRKKRIW